MKSRVARAIIGLLCCIVSLSGVYGQQDFKLARHYYQSGEYEKSALIFKKLATKGNKFNDYYFNYYLESLFALEQYDEAEESIKTIIAQEPNNASLYVAYGNLLERLARPEDAKAQYNKAIGLLKADSRYISDLGNSFLRHNKYDLALATFLKGEELLEQKNTFAYNIAEIYRRKNEKGNMIRYYLRSSMSTPKRMSSAQYYFDRNLDNAEDYELLRKELYTLVKEDPENIFYPEMIQWVFVKSEQYDRALRQAKALDLRLQEDGKRLMDIGRVAYNDQDYDTAIKAYEYITNQKPHNNKYYLDAKKQLLHTRRKAITAQQDYLQEDLTALKNEYEEFFNEFGKNNRTAHIATQYAELYALYLNKLDTAIVILNEVIEYPGVSKYILANAKLDLGDYYLMNGEVWESTLLYSQVDKTFREDHLGELARFKNAKLSYYIGDFEWAQEQFDILKSATTRLISNDAIDLSVFIMDNANLDTTYAPLALYAEAELLMFQNRNKEALQKLDSIITVYPDHGLLDDVMYAKAKYHTKMGDIEKAKELYAQIIEEYPEEIRADNALFALAELYELEVGDNAKAMELYQQLFMEYSDSTFALDARKRFRRLRGDNIQ